MRVTIEHREVQTGVLGKHKESYIDCTVNFSEEERAIIRERDLYNQGFNIRTSTPLPSKGATLGTGLMRGLGPLMMIAGFVWGLAGGGTPTGLLFFAGAGFAIYGWYRSRREDKRFENSEQEITVKQLLNKPAFSVHAWNPAAAKSLDQDLRENLATLKTVIQNSADIQAKQTFEL